MSFDADILPSIVFGLFVSVALISGLQMIRAEIRAVGGAENRIADLCFWLMVAAIAGARCGDLLYRPATVFDDPFEILRLWNGGSFYYGGAAAALITGVVFIKHARLPLWKTADMFAPTLAIGHFFVWIGCFFSELFSGTRSHSMIEAMLSWPEEGLSSMLAMPHPRSLYLASGSFIIFIILLMLRGNKNFDGKVFWIFITLHNTLQLVVDTFDFPGYGHLSPAIFSAPQIISALFTLVGLTMLLYLWHRSRPAATAEF
jgi:phosphatidylglycerol:prolipoprotein diacylglycerol transferase